MSYVSDEDFFAEANSRKRTRKAKVASGTKPTPKPSEVNRTEAKLNTFQPTPKQWELIDKISENTATFISAPAATGKTATTLWYFCKQYLRDPSLEIIVTRTPAEAGKDKIGALPNSLHEKCEPHFASTKKLLEQFLGKEKVNADIGKRIHFTIPNFTLGATFDNKLWLIDEAQLLQPIIMKLLLERIGKNTKVVVSGSASQIYTGDKDRNGMMDAMKRLFNEDGSSKYPDFAKQTFTVEDVMRSDIVKSVLHAYGDI